MIKIGYKNINCSEIYKSINRCSTHKNESPPTRPAVPNCVTRGSPGCGGCTRGGRPAGQRPRLGAEPIFPGSTGRKCWLKIVGPDPTVLEERVSTIGSPVWSQASTPCALGAHPTEDSLQGAPSPAPPAVLAPTPLRKPRTLLPLREGPTPRTRPHAGTRFNAGAFKMSLFRARWAKQACS